MAGHDARLSGSHPEMSRREHRTVRQKPKSVMAGLVPAIHAPEACAGEAATGVDARIKSGHDDLGLTPAGRPETEFPA
jgi:hypothetical protein